MISRKDHLSKLTELVGTPQIKLITGPRRSGKSTLLVEFERSLLESGVAEEMIMKIDLEQAENRDLKDPYALYEKISSRAADVGTLHLMLDEACEVGNWDQILCSLADELAGKLDIVATCSIGGDIERSLAEKAIEIKLLPLTVSEAVEADPTGALARSCAKVGGLPGILTLDRDDVDLFQLLGDALGGIVMRDVVRRSAIRDAGLLWDTMRFFAAKCGSMTSVKEAADALRIGRERFGVETIYNYARAIEASGIFFRVPRKDLKSGRLLGKSERFFAADIGILRVLGGTEDGVAHNIVYLELRRAGYEITAGRFASNEIDFAAERGDQRFGIRLYRGERARDVRGFSRWGKLVDLDIDEVASSPEAIAKLAEKLRTGDL